MTDPIFPEQLAQLSADIAGYVAEQREKYRPSSLSIPSQQMSPMAAYFTPELLAEVRVMSLSREQLGTPTFFLVGLDLLDPSALSLMAATTFFNVIVANVPLTTSTLFHELVHCEQYRQLGIRGFAESYAQGYLDQGGYHGIPLEEQAYILGANRASNPDEPFSVEREVAAWVAEGRF